MDLDGDGELDADEIPYLIQTLRGGKRVTSKDLLHYSEAFLNASIAVNMVRCYLAPLVIPSISLSSPYPSFSRFASRFAPSP